MINFIVEVDETKEPKELIEYLKQHHDILIYCKDCECYDNENYRCSLVPTWKAPNDHCKYANYANKS